MWCLRCGSREPGLDEKCCHCSNNLGPADSRIGYFNQMMVLTGELLTNKLDIESYEKSIQWAAEAIDDMNRSLEPVEKQMKLMGLDDLGISLMMRPLTSFREGIQTFNEGLEKLRFYVYEQNQGYLHQGLTLLEKANNLFNYTADTANYMMGDLKKNFSDEQVEAIKREAEKKLV